MNSRVEKVIELLDLGLDDARVIGIWGMGGIGKTTITRAVYDYISSQFDSFSFIENVREVSKRSGLKTLQEQLISEILMERDLKVGNIGVGLSMIKNRVCCKKVLIVLDDVDESVELERLIGKCHWFGFGSRIIITTRDKHLLFEYGVRHVYEAEELSKVEAIELFNSKAFNTDQHKEGYGELLDRVVEYAKGVPLALKVLGSFLCGRNKGEWESALNRLKEIPGKVVGEVLRISYDALDWNEKEIFLDIACFFKGKDKNDLTKILDSCGFNPGVGINVLVEKSLITISDNKLLMHDLIQKLGWEIVHQESPKEPGKRSRLWLFEDVYRALMDNAGTQAVEGIVVEYNGFGGENPECFVPKQLMLSPKAFANMKNLRFLKIFCTHLYEGLEYLPNSLRFVDWCGYPLKYMPLTFQPEYLVELNLTYSRIEQLWKGTVLLDKLRVLNLSFSAYLKKSPDFTRFPNLERLILEGCVNLVNLHESLGVLKRLVCLNLKDCKNLRSLPSGIHLESLEILIVSRCSKLENILESFGHMNCLSELYLDGTSIKELPHSIERFTNLALINLRDCRNLRSLPNNISQLKALKTLILSGCSKLEKLPEGLGLLSCLKELRADWTAIRQTPSSIVLLKSLETLSFQGCKRSTCNSWSSSILSLFFPQRGEKYMALKLPALSGFESLTNLNLRDCYLKSIPTDICRLSSLQSLGLSGNDFDSLPGSFNQLSKLVYLSVTGCKMLRELPELSPSVSTVNACNCESLTTISSPAKFKNIDGFWFTNCFKLAENKHNILTDTLLSNQFQGSYGRRRKSLNIIFPGSEIPKWFTHQNATGHSVSIKLPRNWYNKKFLGFSVCAAIGLMDDILLKIGIQVKIGESLRHYHPYISCVMKYETLWVGYISRHFLDLNQLEVDRMNEGGIEFVAHFIRQDDLDIADGCMGYKYDDKLNLMHPGVKKCGARLVYEDDDEVENVIATSKRRRDVPTGHPNTKKLRPLML
ncbi:TMV resistance protein like [Actinidia chinensis var. chinensis]|uniref:ADP-ribosyl cyclase/cyclic ADP-ribose hydrolase n=1 Tax=Actinidia chinensis var. chinensis TaxID=1590841 RepID=A0A2R6QP69_ACTCC|nr:TMV resistance protein like [Actinidia chinensis var. chinensis]